MKQTKLLKPIWLAAMLLLLSIVPLTASAYDFKVDGIAYNYNGDGTVTVTFTQQWSNNYSGLTSANIPSSVIYDGITYTVTSIGEYAFYGCNRLTSVTIPNSITYISTAAFQECSNLTSVIIPDSVTAIDYEAFSGCRRLTSIIIPNSVNHIGEYAFYCCTSLTSISIPNSVTYIGHTAFSGCSGLGTITVDNENPAYDSRDNCNAIIETATNTLINGCKNTIIPNSVSSICDYAFFQCSGLKGDFIIPNSVTSIGEYAFYQCTGLTSITIGNSVTSIGLGAFCECTGLTSITIPNSVTTIGGNAFGDCSGLTCVQITDLAAWCNISFEDINANPLSCAHHLFLNGSEVKDLIIPNSITTIGDNSFYCCNGLTSITIPNSVTYIGTNAFYWCAGLTSVTIGESVSYIDYCAFHACEGVTSLVWNAINCNSMGYMPTSNLETVTIGEQVQVLPDFFASYSKITSISIPNSVTSIGTSAFSGCGELLTVESYIENPTSVSMGNDVFKDINSNCILIVPSGTVNAYKNSYQWQDFIIIIDDPTQYISFEDAEVGRICISNWDTNSDNLLSYDEAASVTTLGDVFRNNHSIISFNELVHFTGLLEISDNAFNNCNKLNSILIPNTITSIGEMAFSSCTSLTSITIPDSVTSIGHSSFQNCSSLTGALSIPNSVITIGEKAFYNCSGLTSISIGNSVASIGNSAFSGCSGLTDVTIPNSVTSIGDHAFSGCSALTDVIIPNSVTSISDYAFSGCNGLISITIPASVTFIGARVFYDCSSLMTVNWDAKRCNVFSIDLDNAPFMDLANITLFNFGDEVEHIPPYLCYSLTGLTNITIPNSVTTIGEGAFWGCTGVTSISISNSVTSIGSSVFYGCSGLTNVMIPNSVTSINDYAFSGCSALTNIGLPNSLISIGSEAFRDCSGLTNITVPDSVTFIGDHAFSGCSGLTYIMIPNSVTSIEDGTFNGCTGLTNVTIPDSVASIGNYAFNDCNSLTSVTLPNLIISIGDYAFSGCNGLTKVTIPNSVTSIGTSAFYGCSNLVGIYNHINHPTDVTLGASVFDGVNSSNCTLYVTKGRVEEYRNANQWKDFINIVEGDWMIPVDSISLNKSELSLFAGKTASLQAQIFPVDPSYPQLIWQSSDSTIATVDQNGLVTALSVGNTTITVSTTDGTNLIATCEVTVNGTTSLTLNKEEALIYIGNSETLVPSIEPLEMAHTLIWHSSNPDIATVDQNGLVTALAVGSAIITVSTTDGTNLSASCQVTINYEYALIADTIKHARGEDAAIIDYPVELINANVITGLQFEIQLPYGVTLMTDNDGNPDIWLDDSRKASNHIIDVSTLGQNRYFFIVTSPTNKELQGHDGTLFYMKLLVDQYHNVGYYNINYTNLTLTEANEIEHMGLNTSSTVQLSYLLGDADADAKVDVADYITTALYIMHRPTLRFYADAANVHTVNPDINVTDLTGITNIALGIRPTEILYAPAQNGTMPLADMEPEMDVSVNCLDADRWIMSLYLSNNQSVAAMQFDLQLPDGMTIDDATLTGRAGNLQLTTGTLDNGSVRLLASAFSDAEIESGNDAVLNVILKGNPMAGGTATLRNIVVAERNLNSYEPESMMVPFIPTAIDDATLYNEVHIYGENGNVVIESPVAGTAQLVLINGISTPLEVQPGRNVYPVNSNEYYIVRFNNSTAKIKF